MDDFMIWPTPLVFFLCVAAVQALRKRWQNALSAGLAAGVSLAIMGWSGQAHTNTMLRTMLHQHEVRIEELERQLGDQGEAPTRALEETVSGSKSEQRADH
ncbi:MAG: hypothetical protein HN849_29300 [Victivallales bacterium]|jgi:hypothetical protein|nr:hypothetical protein [Victivallales bacterium]